MDETKPTHKTDKEQNLDAIIAFQGEQGANSHIACRLVYPAMQTLPCATFEAAFRALQNGQAQLAMIPVENTVAGRVADIHRLLPGSGLYIIGEHFMPIHHCLLGLKNSKLENISHIHSHEMALGQCRELIAKLQAKPIITADTAGAAREIAALGDPAHAAIASSLAAEIHDLAILQENTEDMGHNTTRFLIMANQAAYADPDEAHVITSFIFRARNVPAALYKALGGFASNGVNMTKLESYQLEGSFTATMFYADIEGHPESEAVRLALEELRFFCSKVDILGVYKADPYRTTLKA